MRNNNNLVFVKGQEVEVRTVLALEIWYVGKIIRVLREGNKYLVEYPTSVKNPFEEIVSCCRLRPLPPSSSPQHCQNQQFQLNQVVEAFYNDAWCKGVVTKVHVGCPLYSVFFKDEEKERVFRHFNLRVHLDWINGMWFSSQNKEAEVLALNHASFQTPIPVSSSICGTYSSICRTYMDISRTPSERKLGSPSTPNKTQVEMIAIAHNDRTLLAPIRTKGSSCCHDMSTSIKPCNEKLQKKQHPDLPSTQMKEPLKRTDIKLNGIGGMDNQIVVCKGQGGSLIGSGPRHEVACEELTVDQMETTQLLSMPVEVCLPLSPSLEKSSSPAEKENREVSPDNQLIPSEAIAQIDASVESLVLLESSNTIENVFVAEYTTLNPLIQYEDANEDERGLHSANVAENTSPAQYNVHDESLPFIKSSPLWETFDSIEVFQLMPQHPHFRPLEKYDEEFREGYEVGNMVNFANLAKTILKTKLEEPRSLLEKKLEALAELEELGFTVQSLRFLLDKLLRIKDNYAELDVKSKTAEREFTEEKCKSDELQDLITRLKMKLKTLMTDRQMKVSDVADQQNKVEATMGSISCLKRNFDSLATSPFVVST